MVQEVRRQRRPVGPHLSEVVQEVPAERLVRAPTAHEAVAAGAAHGLVAVRALKRRAALRQRHQVRRLDLLLAVHGELYPQIVHHDVQDGGAQRACGRRWGCCQAHAHAQQQPCQPTDEHSKRAHVFSMTYVAPHSSTARTHPRHPHTVRACGCRPIMMNRNCAPARGRAAGARAHACSTMILMANASCLPACSEADDRRVRRVLAARRDGIAGGAAAAPIGCAGARLENLRAAALGSTTTLVRGQTAIVRVPVRGCRCVAPLH